MTTFIQLTIAGLSNGAILALAALGFALIYKATGVLNFAQGELLLIGAYMVFTGTVDLSLPWPLAILFAIVVAVAVGVVVERLILRQMIGRSPVSIIMVTIGLAEFLRSAVQLRYGTAPKRPPGFIPTGAWEVNGIFLPVVRLWAVGLAALMLVLLSLIHI